MNPVPKIEYPDWLHKRIKANDDKFKQKDMKHFFKVAQKPAVTEIEDLITMGVVSQKKGLQIEKEREEKEQQRLSKEKYSKMEDCPDLSENGNFNQWIKFQKQNWRKIRQNMKENKQVANPNTQNMNRNVGLTNFMRNMDEVILNSDWQIISIEQ